jgi:hypothetical protein
MIVYERKEDNATVTMDANPDYDVLKDYANQYLLSKLLQQAG